jgi:hypothetical protein
MSEKISELSKVYCEYKIYPLDCFNSKTFIRKFQSDYKDNHFSRDIEIFLSHHKYSQDRIGADLPWWGSKYFTNEEGFRIMIISQDSLSEDAGSVALYANLMPLMSVPEYERYIRKFEGFSSWSLAKNFFQDINIDFDFVFITDGRKVYPTQSLNYQGNSTENRKKRKSFIQSESTKFMNLQLSLLKEEIRVCNPDVIIVLGKSINLFDKKIFPSNLYESDCCVEIEGISYIVPPFPSTANPYFLKHRDSAVSHISKKLEELKTAKGLLAK